MHSPTLLFCVLLLVILMTMVTYFAWRLNTSTGGLREWFFAFLAALLNILLFMARPALPHELSAFILQALLLSTGVFALVGTYRYLERPDIPYRLIFGSAAATLTATLAVLATSGNQLIAFALGSIVTGVYFQAMGWIAWTARFERYPARDLFAIATFFHGVFMCGRTFLLLDGGADMSFSQIGWSGAQLILVEQLVITPLFGLGLLMLANEKNANELRRLAEVDSLTDLYNRGAFLKNLEECLKYVRRKKTPLCVFMMDLDHFKSINDTYGHDVGDAALKSVTAIVQGCLRKGDVMGRLGGEEFAIFMANTELADALAVAERIREKVSASPVMVRGQAITCSVSIGVSRLESGESLERLLRRADEAMYSAKDNGRNRVEYASG